MSSDQLEQAQAALERHLQDYFSRQKSRYSYGEWFDPIYFDLCEFVGRKAKRIRPLMLMLSYRAFDGTRPLNHPSVLDCATALELLHSFILIHDDVIDRSETRRGLPTFHRLAARRLSPYEDQGRIGENIAMVMGDMVFTMAVRAMHQTDFEPARRHAAMDAFLQYSADTGCGEIYDILFSVRDIDRVTIADIERMYYLKTTRYTFEAPCVMGAILAGASAEKQDALRQITTPLGLAFQIQNDLLECRFRDDDPTPSNDLMEGKKTMVVREAYDRLNEVDRSFLQLCLGATRRTESTMLKLRDLILKSGALESLHERSEALFAEATAAVESPAFTGEESGKLAAAMAVIRQQAKISV